MGETIVLVIVQFPISDARRFSPSSEYLSVPDWPPRTGLRPQFVRYFGGAVRRKRGPDEAWLDEVAFCLAGRALRFPGLLQRRVGLSEASIVPACVFRRFFHDGLAVARVEVGLAPARRSPLLPALPPPTYLKCVTDLLALPTRVRRDRELPLVLQGRNLARLYGRASTKCTQNGITLPNFSLVEDGRPTVIVQLDSAEFACLPEVARVFAANSIRGAVLAFMWLATDWGPIGTWLLSHGSAQDEDVRCLRICLLRLHAEREALDSTLRQLARGNICYDPQSDAGMRLEKYLNEATRRIGKVRRYGAPQSMLNGALDAVLSSEPDSQSEVEGRLAKLNWHVKKKLMRHLEIRGGSRIVKQVKVIVQKGGKVVLKDESQNISGGTFSGPVINRLVAERVENSFQTFGAAAVSDDLKKAVSCLHEEVKKLASQMDKKGVGSHEDVAAHLEAFLEQAAKPKPIGGVLQVTGKGLVEAAKMVAEMAGPITTAVNGVLKIFGLSVV